MIDWTGIVHWVLAVALIVAMFAIMAGCAVGAYQPSCVSGCVAAGSATEELGAQ